MPEYRARIILLGASNVTKAISTIIETAQQLIGSPLDVYTAIGHGRSYGLRSYVLLRSLPSVLDSRLWEIIQNESNSQLPTYALLGDIGNDVMYGPPPERIAGWIDECFDRLHALNAKVICTSLPLARVERLKEWEYLVARTLLFPTKCLSFAEAMGRAREVVDRVEQIADRRGIPFVELPGEWYGVDPIHIRRKSWAEAWGVILHQWVSDRSPDQVPYRARGSLTRWLTLRTCSPEKWWLFGNIPRGRAQPCATLTDGTRVSMY